MSKRLAFYYHIPVHMNSGVISAPGYLGVFIDALAGELGELVLIAHTTDIPQEYKLSANNIRLIDLGQKKPAWMRHLFPGQCLKRITSQLKGVEQLLVRAPTPLAHSFKRYVPKTTGIHYYLVGDYESGANEMHPRNLREWLVKQYLYLSQRALTKVIAGENILVNSPALKSKWSGLTRGVEVVPTTTLRENDFFRREDTCIQRPIKLLYTGRLDLQKGLVELVEALGKLNRISPDFELHLVGWEDDKLRPVEKILREKAEILGLEGRIFFHGKKKLGDELNAMYRMADIYVIPSYHEGFPRTIWEAMANSLPVIATKVGAIPEFLEDSKEVWLIPPRSSDAIVQAVKTVVENPTTRKSIVEKAFAKARANTVENRARQLVETIYEGNAAI